jgi:hypothetical protein
MSGLRTREERPAFWPALREHSWSQPSRGSVPAMSKNAAGHDARRLPSSIARVPVGTSIHREPTEQKVVLPGRRPHGSVAVDGEARRGQAAASTALAIERVASFCRLSRSAAGAYANSIDAEDARHTSGCPSAPDALSRGSPAGGKAQCGAR